MEYKFFDFFLNPENHSNLKFPKLSEISIEGYEGCFINLKAFLEVFDKNQFDVEYQELIKNPDHDYFELCVNRNDILSVKSNKKEATFDVCINITNYYDNGAPLVEEETIIIRKEDFIKTIVAFFIYRNFEDFFKKYESCTSEESKRIFLKLTFPKLAACLDKIKKDWDTYKVIRIKLILLLNKLKSITIPFVSKSDVVEYPTLFKFYFKVDHEIFDGELGFINNEIATKCYEKLLIEEYINEATTKEAFINIIQNQATSLEKLHWQKDLKDFVAFIVVLESMPEIFKKKNKNSNWQIFKDKVTIKDKVTENKLPIITDSCKSTKANLKINNKLLIKFEHILEKL
jgi:hypothetical protein